MKLFLLPLGLFALFAPGRTPAQMVAANDRVRATVQVEADRTEKDLPKTNADKVVQRHALKIALSGKARKAETRVVRWTVYARTIEGNDLRVVKQEEFPLALGAQGTQALTTEPVVTRYTPDHSVVKRAALPRGKRVPRAKEVEGTGAKYAGYRVQILEGKTVVGEAVDPPGLEPAK